jgi:TolB protein
MFVYQSRQSTPFALADCLSFIKNILMNVVLDKRFISSMNIFFNSFVILVIGFTAILLSSVNGQSNKRILLPGIVSELERKQISIDFGDTAKSITPLISKAFSCHGAFRLARPNDSQYTLFFTNSSRNQVEVSVLGGKPRKIVKILITSGDSPEEAILKACDKVTSYFLKIPGFFAGKLTYISNLSGHKEIYVSNALMSTSRPNTNFKKICFNPSWENSGRGLFFTSNRQVFNNIFYLNLDTRKVSTIANFQGSNLSAVQNPRTGQLAMILSGKRNPDVWIAANPSARPKQLTRNKSNESGPCWSADGRRLLVTSDSRGKPQLYEVSLSTGVLTRIPTNVSSHCVEASWNPLDQTKITFTAAVGGGFQIFEYDFLDRKSRQLTQGSNHGLQSTWLNDGRHIIYTERSTGGGTRLMILDTELHGSKPRPLHGANFGNCSQASFFYPKQ